MNSSRADAAGSDLVRDRACSPRALDISSFFLFFSCVCVCRKILKGEGGREEVEEEEEKRGRRWAAAAK